MVLSFKKRFEFLELMKLGFTPEEAHQKIRSEYENLIKGGQGG
jgi:hypothetical protein